MKRQLSKGRTVVSSSSQSSLIKRKVETGSVECNERTKRRRIAETVKAACKIHGGSEKDMGPSTIGLLQTIEGKCKEKDIYNAIDQPATSMKKMKKAVFPKMYQKELKDYERSIDNIYAGINYNLLL